MYLVPGRGHDILVELINKSNTFPVPLTSSMVTFGQPRVSADLPNGTLVAVYPLIGTLYRGKVDIKYQRLDLTSAFGGIRPFVKGLGGPSLHYMLDEVNKQLGLALTADDIEDVSMNWVSGGDEINIPFKSKATSLSYQGEFSIKFQRQRLTLTDLVKTQALDVHRFLVDPTTGVASVDMALWGKDFTEEFKSEILRTTRATGYQWYDPTRLRAFMNTFGFASWPLADVKVAPLEDKATRDVPKANKRFERVIVQKNVVGAGYKGTAYFHYNRS